VGTISIETDKNCIDEAYRAHHREVVPGDYVILAVSDDGAGMDKDTQDMIFEPFFTTKEVGKGTGLGLSTVFGIVKQNNGFVYVYSELGKGTTLRIYLPRYRGRIVEDQKEDVAEAPRAKGETVLVVEDEGSILHLAEIILKRLGYTVVLADHPAEALRLAKAHDGDISLLITDVIMPGMDGRALTDKLQSLYPSIRCLYMSGYTADVIAQSGVLDPGIHFIQKPFNQRDLALKIREVLDG
jgi:CheY-like chemotaxis protein